jgi:hypothetical protein
LRHSARMPVHLFSIHTALGGREVRNLEGAGPKHSNPMRKPMFCFMNDIRFLSYFV